MEATIIPEVVLYNLITGMVNHVSADLESHSTDPENSFIGRMLMGIKDHKHDYFIEAQSLFSRRDDNPRKIRTRLFFDAQEAHIPTIHVTMPQENSGQNSLGAGEYGHEDYTYTNSLNNEESPARERRFDTNYQILITSDNHREVLIIYHIVRGMLISALSEVNIAGLENPRLGGQDIRTNENIIPSSIFMRGISLQCSYDVLVPRFFSSQQISQLIINPGTVIVP